MNTPFVVPAALIDTIAERAESIRARIVELTDRPVRLVGVTKGHPAEVAAAVFAAGCDDLGESYAQELVPKARTLSDAAAAGTLRSDTSPRWHFIGRLQTNKVRSLVEVVDLWESVDRASLAREIAKRAPGAAVLVQLDLAGLPGRGGCDPADAPALVEHCRELGLDVRGLMGVGAPGGAEAARPGFRLLSAMADELGLAERSMGMSADLQVAVEEGSTSVRVGTALVGPRA
ncbi:MAG: YggS family pyridoxal phosphate enzyme [Microthrixaceae bacterium]